MSKLCFDLHAAGVLAPGMASLAELRATCRSGLPPPVSASLVLPNPAMLPANERRRASQVVRLTLACIDQALRSSPFPVENLHSVFATDEGTGEVCQQMMEALATTRQVSPLMFPNSVHNAPSGYFSIAWRNRQSATVASQGPESFASGLLCAVSEATATGQPVLFVAYDPAMTVPINELLSTAEPTATAWILSAGGGRTEAPVLGSFALVLEPAALSIPTPLPVWLPPRWAVNSSARALAALGLLEAAPNTPLLLALGGQVVNLQCVDGAIP
jgi:hypothetical protein